MSWISNPLMNSRLTGILVVGSGFSAHGDEKRTTYSASEPERGAAYTYRARSVDPAVDLEPAAVASREDHPGERETPERWSRFSLSNDPYFVEMVRDVVGL